MTDPSTPPRRSTSTGQSPWLDNLRRGGSRAASWRPGSSVGSGASRRTRRSSRRRSAQAPTTTPSSASSMRRWQQRHRRLLGPRDLRHPRRPRPPAPRLRRERRRRRLRVGRGRPDLARDTAGTEAAARQLHEAIAEPNLYVKIPAPPRARADPAMIAEGRSINVTLIFSLDRYAEVMEAYLSGLEAARGRPRPHLERGQLLRLPGRHRGRPPPRGDRHRRGPGPPGHGRRRPGPGGLPAVPRHVPGAALGCARGSGRAGAATAVGVDVDQEPRLPRHGLRRPAHRTRHGQHDARGDARRLRRPRHGRPHGRRRPGGGRGHAGCAGGRRRRPRRRRPGARGRGRRRLREVVRRAARRARGQGRRAGRRAEPGAR